jgi:ferrous iron transport protein A
MTLNVPNGNDKIDGNGNVEAQQLIPLDQLLTGKHGVIRQLRGGKEFTSRLTAMGLAIGSAFEVLQNRGRGPVLVRARGTRIALGRGEALKILVEAVAADGAGSGH